MKTPTTTQTSLKVSRIVKAPPKRVWQALTKPEEIARWYAPGPLEAKVHEFDLRVGGAFHIAMVEPGGGAHTARGTFIAVEPPTRLVHTWRWEEYPTEAGESQVTVELREVPEGTEVVLTHEKLANAESVKQHTEGWQGCLEKLAELF